ncbi:MAG: hypothetical protein IPN34_15015 [Planctomycetes bacterium]|nr:hypothetical protein [Planctomycetota bacterium]
MKLLYVAVIAFLLAGCESNPRPASPRENAGKVDHSFREPFLREKERILSEMVQAASEAVQKAKSFVDQGRASQDQVQRLEAELLERRIEHDDLVSQLALFRSGTNGSPSSATTAKRAHLDRVAQWLDQIVDLRRDLVSLSVRRAEVGLANSNDVMADRMELQRALLRVQDLRMELAELSAAAKTHESPTSVGHQR